MSLKDDKQLPAYQILWAFYFLPIIKNNASTDSLFSKYNAILDRSYQDDKVIIA